MNHRAIALRPKRPLTGVSGQSFWARNVKCCFTPPSSCQWPSCTWKWLKVIENDWKWLKMTESDWKWLKMIENDWKWLKIIESDDCWSKLTLKFPKMSCWDSSMEGGAKQHLWIGCAPRSLRKFPEKSNNNTPQKTPKMGIFRRVPSTPDPDTFHFYRDILAKVCPPLGRKYYIHRQFVIGMIRRPFVSRYFFGSIRVRGRWNTPNIWVSDDGSLVWSSRSAKNGL